MLAIWRDWGIDLILKKAYEKGIILAGISAGSLCWFEQGLSDSIPGKLTALKGLNLLKGSNCPFFDAGKDKQKIYPEMIRSKNILPGVATEVGVGIHYENEKLIGVVTSRKGAKAYAFYINNGEVEKELMEPKFITLKQTKSAKAQMFRAYSTLIDIFYRSWRSPDPLRNTQPVS